MTLSPILPSRCANRFRLLLSPFDTGRLGAGGPAVTDATAGARLSRPCAPLGRGVYHQWPSPGDVQRSSPRLAQLQPVEGAGSPVEGHPGVDDPGLSRRIGFRVMCCHHERHFLWHSASKIATASPIPSAGPCRNRVHPAGLRDSPPARKNLDDVFHVDKRWRGFPRRLPVPMSQRTRLFIHTVLPGPQGYAAALGHQGQAAVLSRPTVCRPYSGL